MLLRPSKVTAGFTLQCSGCHMLNDPRESADLNRWLSGRFPPCD
jgi:hypothetical protein